MRRFGVGTGGPVRRVDTLSRIRAVCGSVVVGPRVLGSARLERAFTLVEDTLRDSSDR